MNEDYLFGEYLLAWSTSSYNFESCFMWTKISCLRNKFFTWRCLEFFTAPCLDYLLWDPGSKWIELHDSFERHRVDCCQGRPRTLKISVVYREGRHERSAWRKADKSIHSFKASTCLLAKIHIFKISHRNAIHILGLRRFQETLRSIRLYVNGHVLMLLDWILLTIDLVVSEDWDFWLICLPTMINPRTSPL